MYALHVVQNVAMRIRDALRAARRSGRVVEVRERIGGDPRQAERRRGSARKVVDVDDRAGIAHDARGEIGELRVGDDERRFGMSDRLPQMRRRMTRVERHIAGPRLENRRVAHAIAAMPCGSSTAIGRGPGPAAIREPLAHDEGDPV